MNNPTLEEIFKRAEGIVKDLPDSLKPVAFKIAVKQLLEEEKKGFSVSEEAQRKDIVPFVDECIKKILKELALPPADERILKSIYNFSPERKVKIIYPLERIRIGEKKNIAEIQRELVYLYLTAKEICYGEREISNTELGKEMEFHKVSDGHVSHNLDKEKGRILFTGKRRGKKYTLSLVGLEKGEEVLKNLIKEIKKENYGKEEGKVEENSKGL